MSLVIVILLAIGVLVLAWMLVSIEEFLKSDEWWENKDRDT